MIRISSSGVIRNFRSNLMNSRVQLEEARQTASDFLAFRNFSTNPAAATRSFQLIRSYGKTQNYIDNSNVVKERLGYAWEVGLGLNDTLNKIDSTISEAMNAKDHDIRELCANTIRGQMESIVQDLNSKYNDEFVFAGQGAGEAPFTLDDDYNLYYRGYNVDTGLSKTGEPFGGIPTAQQIEDAIGVTGKDWNALTDAEKEQFGLKKMDELAEEKLYVDVGLGMKGNNGTVAGSFDNADDINAASAVNVSMPGINLIGYGKDDAGNCKNIISQLRDIANELEKDGANYDHNKLTELHTNFKDSCDIVKKGVSTLDTRVGAVKTNLTHLETNSDTLYTQISDLTTVDPALAYTNFSFAQYYYNSALKIGNSILDQSFIDYMR